MDLSFGTMLFYCGIAGMIIVTVISIITAAVLAGSRKRLRRKLSEEYGGRRK